MNTMKTVIHHIFDVITIGALLVLNVNTYAQDPCSQTTKLSGGRTISNKNEKGNTGNGYQYEIWRDGNGGELMLYNKDACFKASWNNAGDFLGRVGKTFNNPKWNNLGGNLVAEYAYTKSGDDGNSYSYIGIYGWMDSPQIEWYIVDDWLHNRGVPGGSYIGKEIGEITVDGEVYKVWSGQRTGASKWGNSTFTQIFSIRQTQRQCGTIHISEHFRQWSKLGLNLGNLMEAQILAEAGGGSGYVDFSHAKVMINDDAGDGNDGQSTVKEPTEPEGPYKSIFSIPGKIEAEDYDKGGNGFGYKDSDNQNETSQYRQDGVDIEKGGTGYAIGHTTTGEWLKYTIKVEKSGNYDIYANASNGSTDIEFNLELDGKSLCTLSGAGNGGNDWDTYKLISKKGVSLSAGEHTLKVKYGTMYCNLDYIEFLNEGEQPEDDQSEGDQGEEGQSTITTGGTFFDENGSYFGPDCDATNYTGAYYTGNYTSPFITLLGKTESDIQKKLDQMWSHYFENNSNKVYTDRGNGEAYILDTGNNDVRSEGMSYGMMISVQTNHPEHFKKLWQFAKSHMWHNPNNGGDGYFSWQVGTDGGVKDQGCAPDGEMYFMTSLLFAAHRWNNSEYMRDAQAILKSCWKGNGQSLFNEQSKIVTFQPSNGNNSFSDPSYSLPAFVDLFARWSETNNSKWEEAAKATRDHLYKSSNSNSGLFSDYNNFDGTPHGVNFNNNAEKYMYDAMRCAMNFGMDYYLFGKDATRQEEMARRIIDFFEKDNYQHARFNWDGSGASESYTLGETGANAVACYCLMNNSKYDDIVKKNLKKAWDASLMTGQYRYYDGLVHYLAMLHLCGSFKIWKETPSIKTKTFEGNEYLGVSYTTETTINSFEDCQLYSVTIKPSSTLVVENESDNAIIITPNPAENYFEVKSAAAIKRIEIFNMVGQNVYNQNNGELVEINLPAGTYMVKLITDNDNVSIQKLIVK
ncbi:MAG: glycosyl hydrolase family 8 [Paludibacteraceae bacterium]|nr:glycosyl hydrolase family 8 [Paludibacteraceae bacterium]